MHNQRLPIIPLAVLKTHKVNEISDNRFKAAARLLQSLWREDKGLPIGSYRTAKGKRRKLGSRLDASSAKAGSNFITPEIAKLAQREVIYREIGAMINEERFWSNLLSSQPLCLNLFGGLKLDMEKANLFFRQLLPDYVAQVNGIFFEHSPGRANPAFTDDNTAFDVFVTCTTPDGECAFIAIEVKYSETMSETPAALRPRYDELSSNAGVFKDHAVIALRGAPLQQLWREHMLSRAMLTNGSYSQGRFVVIHPSQNTCCVSAINAYKEHLTSSDPTESGFQSVTLENCLEALILIGDDAAAKALHCRYIDFERVERAIFG